MSIVRKHKPLVVSSPRDRGELRAIAGLVPFRLVTNRRDGAGDQLRVARIDGAVVGVCRITPEVMRLGESRLKVGMVRDIAVHSQFNELLIASALREDAQRFLAEHRYHLALTTGSEFELRRFGYTAVFDWVSMRLLPGASSHFPWDRLRLRGAKQGDIAAMSRLYSSIYENVSGSLLRSRGQMGRICSGAEGACVLTDLAGKVVAYFVPRMSERQMHVVEWAYSDPVKAKHLKGVLREFADAAECASVMVHGSSAMMRGLAGSLRLAPSTEVPAGFVSSVDLDELFQSMVPEWECLLSAAPDLGDRECTLVVDGRIHRIRSHHGAVTVDNECGREKIQVNSADIAPLLLGILSPDLVLGSERRFLRPAATEFFRTLFPARKPGLSPLDLL